MSTTPSLDERCRDLVACFGGDSENARFYLAELQGKIDRLYRGIARSVGTIAGMIGLFILLSSGGLTEVEIFGVKASKFSLFLLSLPIVVVFLFLRISNLVTTSQIYRAVYVGILANLDHRWISSGLGTLPVADVAATGASSDDIDLFPQRRQRMLRLVHYHSIDLFALLIPPTFIVYAYVQLYQTASIDARSTSISLTVSTVLYIFALISDLIFTRVTGGS